MVKNMSSVKGSVAGQAVCRYLPLPLLRRSSPLLPRMQSPERAANKSGYTSGGGPYLFSPRLPGNKPSAAITQVTEKT